jgi:hypothetical protein
MVEAPEIGAEDVCNPNNGTTDWTKRHAKRGHQHT